MLVQDVVSVVRKWFQRLSDGLIVNKLLSDALKPTFMDISGAQITFYDFNVPDVFGRLPAKIRSLSFQPLMSFVERPERGEEVEVSYYTFTQLPGERDGEAAWAVEWDGDKGFLYDSEGHTFALAANPFPTFKRYEAVFLRDDTFPFFNPSYSNLLYLKAGDEVWGWAQVSGKVVVPDFVEELALHDMLPLLIGGQLFSHQPGAYEGWYSFDAIINEAFFNELWKKSDERVRVAETVSHVVVFLLKAMAMKGQMNALRQYWIKRSNPSNSVLSFSVKGEEMMLPVSKLLPLLSSGVYGVKGKWLSNSVEGADYILDVEEDSVYYCLVPLFQHVTEDYVKLLKDSVLCTRFFKKVVKDEAVLVAGSKMWW